jgi:hypothetical protein
MITTSKCVVAGSKLSAMIEIGMIQTGTAAGAFLHQLDGIPQSSDCRLSSCRVEIRRLVVSSQPTSACRIE